jgi:hypothetical protein
VVCKGKGCLAILVEMADDEFSRNYSKVACCGGGLVESMSSNDNETLVSDVTEMKVKILGGKKVGRVYLADFVPVDFGRGIELGGKLIFPCLNRFWGFSFSFFYN